MCQQNYNLIMSPDGKTYEYLRAIKIIIKRILQNILFNSVISYGNPLLTILWLPLQLVVEFYLPNMVYMVSFFTYVTLVSD